MGNNGSKKRNKKFQRTATNDEVNILDGLQDPEENGIDSYDKLMAWLLEMATNEETSDSATTSTQINEMKKSISTVKEKRAAAWRQHSASCDSHTSGETSQWSRSARSDDCLDLKSRLHVPLSSRQTTFSDEDDTSSNDGRNRLTIPSISRQTTFSDDEDGGLIHERSHRQLPPVLNRQPSCTVGNYEREFDVDDVSEYHILVPPKDRSKVHDPKEALHNRRKNFRMSGGSPNFSASVGQIPDDRIPLTSGLTQKSASIAVMRQPTFERKQNQDILGCETYENVLDDKLLDRNIRDILLSVEVLFQEK